MEAGVLQKIETEAAGYLSAGEWAHALAEYSVLREIRSRREGPYSVTYLSNLHDCVRCMSHLGLWSDSDAACRELHGKYVRTHGAGEHDTLDVAKHWAWALIHLHEYPPAVRLYLTTADALWDDDPTAARRLLGAALAHRSDADPIAMLRDRGTDGLIDPGRLAHSHDVLATLNDLADHLGAESSRRELLTIDGLPDVA